MTSEEKAKDILQKLEKAVYEFDEDGAVEWAKAALEEGMDPFVTAMEGLAQGMVNAHADHLVTIP